MPTHARSFLILTVASMCAACAQLPPSPADLQAKKFETVPDRAVIYVVRGAAGFNQEGATLLLDDTVMITTYPGTYYRWVVAPGSHRVAGYASDSGTISVNVEQGRIYFVQQWVSFGMLGPRSRFSQVPQNEGRAVVMQSELVGGK